MGSRKRLYRGRGLGLASGPKMPTLASEKGWFYEGENEGFIRREDSGSGRVSDRVPGRLPEVLRRAFGTSGVVEKSSKFTNLAFSRRENRVRLAMNRPGGRAFRETPREGVAILEGTFRDWVFP